MKRRNQNLVIIGAIALALIAYVTLDTIYFRMFFSAENADASIIILAIIVIGSFWLAEKMSEQAELTPLQKKIRNATRDQRASYVMIVLGGIFLLVGNYLSNYYLNRFSGDFSFVKMSNSITSSGIVVLVSGLLLFISSSIRKNKFMKELALSKQLASTA